MLSLDANLHTGEGWYVFADGIVERDFALIDQHHRRHACDGLGDRMDRKDGVRRHRRSLLDVTLAEAFEINRLAGGLDQNDWGGSFSGGNFVIEKIVDG